MSQSWILLMSVIVGVDIGLLIRAVWIIVTEPPLSELEKLPTIANTAALPTIAELNAGLWPKADRNARPPSRS